MATCETHGHLYPQSKCTMCGASKPLDADPVVISLRDQFAMAAMQGSLQFSLTLGVYGNPGEAEAMCKIAYEMADLMLEERKS